MNHGWRAINKNRAPILPEKVRTLIYGLITFLAVVLAWVFFRAETVAGAWQILHGMLGSNGVTLPIKYANADSQFYQWLVQLGVVFDDNLFKGWKEVGQITWALLIVWLLPNSQTLLRDYDVTVSPVTERSRLAFRPNIFTLAACAIVLIYCFTHLTQLSEFLYFRF